MCSFSLHMSLSCPSSCVVFMPRSTWMHPLWLMEMIVSEESRLSSRRRLCSMCANMALTEMDNMMIQRYNATPYNVFVLLTGDWRIAKLNYYHCCRHCQRHGLWLAPLCNLLLFLFQRARDTSPSTLHYLAHANPVSRSWWERCTRALTFTFMWNSITRKSYVPENFQIEGTLVAPPTRSDWSKETIRHWIMFNGVIGLTVDGGGTVDGNGKIWWQNSCKTNAKLVSALNLCSFTVFHFIFGAIWCFFCFLSGMHWISNGEFDF